MSAEALAKADRLSLRCADDNGKSRALFRCLLVLDDFRDLTTAITRCRRLLDLDADPEAMALKVADLYLSNTTPPAK